MVFYDISVPLRTGMHSWPSNPDFRISAVSSQSAGDPANVSEISMSSHAGTHLDAPHHFISGLATVDRVPLEQLIGPCHVVALDVETVIDRESLEGAGLEGVERVLFKTRNSELWKREGFQEEFIYLGEDAARYLIESGVRLIGVDYLSIDAYRDHAAPTHHALLELGIVNIEGLDLSDVEPGEYEIICLPLRIEGCDGSPARVVLRR
ncbi:MAG: cyclase family protein [Candidatus Aquicultorales bacterium]